MSDFKRFNAELLQSLSLLNLEPQHRRIGSQGRHSDHQALDHVPPHSSYGSVDTRRTRKRKPCQTKTSRSLCFGLWQVLVGEEVDSNEIFGFLSRPIAALAVGNFPKNISSVQP
jgi:hypothetical protein